MKAIAGLSYSQYKTNQCKGKRKNGMAEFDERKIIFETYLAPTFDLKY